MVDMTTDSKFIECKYL